LDQNLPFAPIRMARASGYLKESRNYFEKLKVQAAAQIWAAGVPWDEALQIAKRAVEASEPQSRKGQGKGKGKGAAKGRGRS